jgi:hypothetical protein
VERPNLSAAQRAVLLDAPRFQPINSLEGLPESVRKICVDHEGRIAGPGEPFNAGCTIGPGSPPSVRLIWSSYSPEDHVYVLHIERGGVAHFFDVYVVHERDGAATVDWSASSKRLEGYASFVEALKANAFNNAR